MGENGDLQMVLEPVWKAYSVCDEGVEARPLLDKMVSAFSLASQVCNVSIRHATYAICIWLRGRDNEFVRPLLVFEQE